MSTMSEQLIAALQAQWRTMDRLSTEAQIQLIAAGASVMQAKFAAALCTQLQDLTAAVDELRIVVEGKHAE